MDKDQRRREIAVELAVGNYSSDSVEIAGEETILTKSNGRVLSVDDGYWVDAKVFVDAVTVEERLSESPRLRRLKDAIKYHGKGRLEDMHVDFDDPDRFLLVQTSPSDNEPWFTLVGNPEQAAEVIAQDEVPWDFEELVDLDTGDEYELKTTYVFEKEV